MAIQGVETGKVGCWLTGVLRDAGSLNSVFYDHGTKTGDHNVCEPKGFIGRTVNNRSRIKGSDILVGSPDGVVRVVVEIEERPVSPPKIIGDVCTVLMCDGFAARVGREQRYFRLDDRSVLIVAGVVPDKGCRLQKIELIEMRIRQGAGYPSSILPSNIELIFENELSTTLVRLQNRLRKLTVD
jgi:hypothetical protein